MQTPSLRPAGARLALMFRVLSCHMHMVCSPDERSNGLGIGCTPSAGAATATQDSPSQAISAMDGGVDSDAQSISADSVLSEIIEVAEAVPEITDRLRDLAAAHDDSLQLHCIYTELASFVAEVVSTERSCHELLERCLSLVEARASGPPDDREDLVEWAFLGCLPPETLAYVTPCLGPATRAILQDAEP